MGWKKLNLTRKDGKPEPGQLCVIARVWAGSAGGSEQQYLVGCFVRDPRDPKSHKLWWRSGSGGVENPHHGRIATGASSGLLSIPLQRR